MTTSNRVVSLPSPASLLALALASITALNVGCHDDESVDLATSDQTVIGGCVRNEAVLRGALPDACANDAGCPCGSFCDPVEHVCAFTCMVPPASPAEACPTNKQCDDTGRCVVPGAVPQSNGPVLDVVPATFQADAATAPPQQLAAKLRVAASSGPAITAAQATVVRVVAGSGMTVSCNGTSFGPECSLTGWAFSWDGTTSLASKPFWVRANASGNAAERDVTLHVDSTEVQLVIPAAPTAAAAIDGIYTGVARSALVGSGVPVDVRVQGGLILVRDPARIIAPDGALILDLLTGDADVGTPRRMHWLRPPQAADTATLVAEYKAMSPVAADIAAGTLQADFSIGLPRAATGERSTTAWTLDLHRSVDVGAECSADSDCATGSQCAAALHACVPTAVWTPPTVAVGNGLEDARSLTWWNALAPLLGTDAATPEGSAFATTGADLVETVLCTTSTAAADAGRLGVRQLKSGGISRSGDLGCVNSSGGATTVPGAVGLLSRADRNSGSSQSLAMLGTCLSDLARVPAGFGSDFASTTGQCANLARFVPALRLLAGNELGKRAGANDSRTRGLFVRLVQQWSQLHGFVATTGLAQREYDDAVAATIPEAGSALVALLDVIDAGWAALLDKRIAPTVAAAATWAPTATDRTNDYRTAKKPLVYWTFNGSSAPTVDLIRGLPLTQRLASSDPECQILTSRDSILHGWNCPGFRATLPADAPSIGGNRNLSVVMFADGRNEEFTEYGGGTLLQTETMAVVSNLVPYKVGIAVVHPTEDGGTEWVGFFDAPADESIAIVRDTEAMTYTLYRWNATFHSEFNVEVQRYYHRVGGVLPGTAARRIAVMNGNTGAAADRRRTIGQHPRSVSYVGYLDDLAIFDSALSQREFLRFAQTRGLNHGRRDVYPESMTLAAHGTQDIDAPVGAVLLETQAAHLDVVARLVAHLGTQSQAACEGDDAAAVAARDAGIARAGQALRQSFVVDALAEDDDSERAADARRLLTVKRSQIARALHGLTACHNPFGMTESEVPLYFGDITGEVAAFFAASDHLLGLAEPRAGNAAAALANLRSLWDQARQSQLQELQSDTGREIRVEELQSRFGEQLKRLCGIPDRTAAQIMLDVQNGDFSVDTCFVKPTTACLAAHGSGPIMDADPTCYRGIIGSQLMDARAGYHAQQAAYQAWQAAVGNADGAELQCVLKEMDVFGCSALDRHDLEGVECPDGHQGTIALVDAFNDYMDEKEREQSWFNAVVSVVTTAAAVAGAVATTGPGAGFLVAAGGSLGLLSNEMGNSMAERRRRHEAVLQARALEDDIRSCWTSADQFQRAIAAAEEASLEAAARMQAATVNFDNALAEARDVLVEGPVVLEREQTRPAIPIGFHYWLPETISSYRFLLESARRYSYVALRATEFDTQESYTTPQQGKPSRSAVIGAWRPDVLVQQLMLMRDATNSRRTGGGRPSEDHVVLDVAKDVFGLASADDLAAHLEANARPVYSRRGEYLGQGVRFSFLPETASATPSWRCAERLWRSNVAASGFDDAVSVKLLKRTVFGSRSCSDDSFQVGTLRPEANLLVSSGDPQTYVEQSAHTVADIDMVNLNGPNATESFLHGDDFTDGASTELAGQGLFGDYVLLFTAPSLNAGLDLAGFGELYVRFDYVSIDNLPATDFKRRVELDTSVAPIVVD
jgi:hypothetical protein